MKSSGIIGLKKHLTANAVKNLESMESISSRPEISLITTTFMGGNAVKFLLDKLSECEWTVKDVMKGSDSSKAIVGFNYQDSMIGTIEMTMIKEAKIWKIDGLEMPKFEKFSIAQENSNQPAK